MKVLEMSLNPLKKAFQAFDAANAKDPHLEIVEGFKHPRELLYAKRLTQWVKKLKPQASEALLLASRCQHLKRWEIPRTDFDKGRIGYLQWRKKLYQYHADEAQKILKELGYDLETIEKVKSINLKKNLKDPDTQTMEDALCLVFLEYQFSDFVKKTSPEKMPGIIQKTWAKMSETAKEFALQLPFSKEELHFIQKALKVDHKT